MIAGTALKTKALDETSGHESFDQLDTLSVLQKDRQAPLHECVRSAIRYYLNSMGGHEVDGLYRMVIDEVERPLIETVLESTNNNQTVAARMLGMSRSTLRKKIKGLHTNQPEEPAKSK
ncbi:MAG TPA: Fis family transcriptional regulator [Chromatiaceae bacterium]|jgi:Fis family transcriptional regulator|nr:MAG: hypothetical protein N838_09880 [Thiohalocapsa sp. PB-PSB1]QQO54742.1 MAG: Fis family transcriptional regulator [Thiohalocapsa sp. PB-PSB1]HBG96342.1 Fis family transcriptional regulator [Chromatiaceae bacterium]HCS90630.1 Fis family transcriptional regulator [Chromatiaceae bacterium]